MIFHITTYHYRRITMSTSKWFKATNHEFCTTYWIILWHLVHSYLSLKPAIFTLASCWQVFWFTVLYAKIIYLLRSQWQSQLHPFWQLILLQLEQTCEPQKTFIIFYRSLEITNVAKQSKEQNSIDVYRTFLWQVLQFIVPIQNKQIILKALPV